VEVREEEGGSPSRAGPIPIPIPITITGKQPGREFAENLGMEFEHERLDVYKAAVGFLVVADEIAGQFPIGRRYLSDQLRRAALSILLNISEGLGEFSAADKARFYRMARRSGTECAAILDAGRLLELADPDRVEEGRRLLHRVYAMLTAMILKVSGP
jgi:four helix bundle protein